MDPLNEDEDLEIKQRFLESFKTRKVIGSVLKALNIKRSRFREWERTDDIFRKRFSEIEDHIDDEALEIAYGEIGLLRKKTRKAKIDKIILRDVLRRHPRFRLQEQQSQPQAAPLTVKGIDVKVLLQIVGGNIKVAAQPPAIPATVVEMTADHEHEDQAAVDKALHDALAQIKIPESPALPPPEASA